LDYKKGGKNDGLRCLRADEAEKEGEKEK